MSLPIPVISKGLVFSFNSQSLTALSITPPGYVSDKVDVTNLSSAAMEYIASLPDPGQAKVKISHDQSNTIFNTFLGLIGGAKSTASYTFPLTPSGVTGSTISGSAFIAGYEVDDVSPGEQITGTFTLQHSGMISYVAQA